MNNVFLAITVFFLFHAALAGDYKNLLINIQNYLQRAYKTALLFKEKLKAIQRFF